MMCQVGKWLSCVLIGMVLIGCSGKPKPEMPKAVLNYHAEDDGSIAFTYTLPFVNPLFNQTSKQQKPKGGQYRSLQSASGPLDPALMGITDPQMEEMAEVGLDAALDEKALCLESITIKQRQWTHAGYQLSGHCR
ncbi:hypothetical protein ACFSJ3_14040 [Corallincola platygyrae]|uniref:Lipoprotein n=1 Tax=Corallincola platygyrae TaxID=1193278 RepID=A0ABW4XQ64_9GAMM